MKDLPKFRPLGTHGSLGDRDIGPARASRRSAALSLAGLVVMLGLVEILSVLTGTSFGW